MSFREKYFKSAGGTQFLGYWDASTNTPTLVSSQGQKNSYYIVSVSGATSLDGESNWVEKDWVYFTGSAWVKVDNTDSGEAGSPVIDDSINDNITDRVPSQNAVYDALALKQDIITGAATTVTSTNLATNQVLVSDSSGKIATSNITSPELAYLSGVTSAIQSQINSKLNRTGAVTISGGAVDPKLTILAAQLPGTNTSSTLELWSMGTGASVISFLNSTPDSTPFLIQRNASDLIFSPSNSGKIRISSAGHLYINSNASANTVFSSTTTSGLTYQNASYFAVSRSGSVVQYLNRITNDGAILEFRQDGVAQGTVSVSGSTVSYNAFAGSHWSQLSDGSRLNILRGTVMETIDEMCDWPGEEPTERLPKCKISDTPASKKVYGVFMAWDDDWTVTNDMYVTALGSFVCRVAANQTVESGDLLESNGDGCARVQIDDLTRSSTIGKVTSSTIITTYEDGSYLVPVVLYCG